MSYVVPNGQVKILTGVPIEDNFEHSLYFANANSQYNYFNARLKGAGYSFNDMSHIRVTTPGRKLRVEINVNNLLDCNYLMIQNNNTGKWFYCFIDKVEYVNETVSEITYTVDPIQTWMFDYSSNGILNNYCFVERQHSTTDVAGDNLVNEPVNTGDYVIQNAYLYPSVGNWCMVIVTTVSWQELTLPSVPTSPQFIGGTLDSVNILAYPVDNLSAQEQENTVNAVKQFMLTAGVFGASDKVLSVFMLPEYYLRNSQGRPLPGVRFFTASSTAPYDDNYGTYDSKPSMGYRSTSISQSLSGSFVPYCYPHFDDYSVRNNKLLTYPYCYMEGKNTQGDTVEFKYELFNQTFGKNFNVYCVFSANPQIICVPTGYGLSDNVGSLNGILNFDKALVIKDVPKCAFATNDFAAKLVQSTISMGITAVGYAVGGAVGGALAGAETPVPEHNELEHYGLSQKAAIRQMGREQYRDEELAYREEMKDRNAKIQNGRKLGGAVAAIGLNAFKNGKAVNFGSGNASLVTDTFGFLFSEIRIKKEYARIIDEFFDMYGYAQSRVMRPNIHARVKWTYVKTTNCTISGSIPNDDAGKINEIFNNGITFWVNGSEVGDYSLANLNRPL